MKRYNDGLAIAVCAAIGAVVGTWQNLLCQYLCIGAAVGALLDIVIRAAWPGRD